MPIKKPVISTVNLSDLPPDFPLLVQDPFFWECLGRTVATFGHLEYVLKGAIFSFTLTTKPNSREALEKAYSEWIPKLKKSLSDPLGGLINTYDEAVSENPEATLENLDDLLERLRKVSKIRNVLCHAAWRKPDQNGASVPFLINRQNEVFETPIDVSFLKTVQRCAAELICDVIDSVTRMGWQFPGTNGPGDVIF